MKSVKVIVELYVEDDVDPVYLEEEVCNGLDILSQNDGLEGVTEYGTKLVEDI